LAGPQRAARRPLVPPGCSATARPASATAGAGRAVLRQGQRLAAAQVNVIVKLAVARLAEARGELAVGEGSPAECQRTRLAFAKDYSGHSLRVGAAQDMAAVGIGTAAILQAGGWKDERMVRRYIRKLGALEGGMAQFFGREAG
jgi:hypothetical protein